jgi:6-phosphogluconolactonase (cycloisomerase 2 family)
MTSKTFGATAGFVVLACAPAMAQNIFPPPFTFPGEPWNTQPLAPNFFAYVASSISHDVSGYKIDPISGGLTPVPGSPFVAGPTGAETNGIRVDPQGLCAVATNENNSSVQAFMIDPNSGALIVEGPPVLAGVPVLNGPNPGSYRPDGRFLYIPDEAEAEVYGYTVSQTDCTLAPIAGSPFAVPGGPFTDSAVVDPSGQFLYVTVDKTPGFVSGFKIDANSGALTVIAGSPFAAGNSPDSVIVHPSGKFLYAANYEDNTISGYTIDPTTGVLTPIAGSPFALGGSGPDAITMHPSGKWLYSANDINIAPGVGNTDGFIINQTTGALTLMTGSPFAALAPSNSSSGVAIDPGGSFLYLANENSNNLSAFTINQTTGIPTPIGPPVGPTFASGTEPASIVTAAPNAWQNPFFLSFFGAP